MPPTYFKFTTPEGVNRRLTFSEPPDWPLLASKLNALYGIPLDHVGVSYVDNDNDEITVSSDEELQDFYKVSHQVGQVIKFAVIDLQNNAGKPVEFLSLDRHPFDGDAFELVGEWERFLPILVTEDKSTSGPHAFVEVLGSSVTHDEMDTDSEDDHSTAQPRILNKGKGRSLSFGAASITSVLGEEMSHKHPIHVYDLNSRKDDKGNNLDDSSNHHVPAQSTPKVQVKNVDDNRDTEETPAPSKVVEVEDPPLPSLDEPPASSASASLFHDLASLVHDVTQVVSSHPELAEGFRNIGRNMSSGTYWTTHREALSNAVNGMFDPTSTEERRQAEEVAATRLTDMIGNFFKTMSQVPVNTEDTRAPNINENPTDQENPVHFPPPWGHRMRSFGSLAPRRGLRGSRYHGHFPPYGPVPHGPHTPGYGPHIPPMPPVHRPVHHPPGPHGPPHGPPYGPPHGRQGRPPSYLPRYGPLLVPSPPPHIPVGPSPHRSSLPIFDRPSPFHGPPLVPLPPPDAGAGAHPSLPTYDHTSSPLPPLAQGRVPPPPPPPPLSVPPPNEGSAPIREPQPEMHSSDGPSNSNRRHSYSFIPLLPVSNDQPLNQSNAQDLRAEVEAVKRIYKDVKGRYRQERNQRRQEKLARKPTVRYSATVGSAPVGPPENSREREGSSAQLQDPEVERVGAPKRSNTHLGHGPFRHLDKKPEDLTTRAIGRIVKKFADMGFSENAYPALPEKIKAQIRPDGAISKEEEDDVVTTLLEELLATTSLRPNVASGSGQRDVDMAEAWH